MVVLDHIFNPAMYSTKQLWRGIVIPAVLDYPGTTSPPSTPVAKYIRMLVWWWISQFVELYISCEQRYFLRFVPLLVSLYDAGYCWLYNRYL